MPTTPLPDAPLHDLTVPLIIGGEWRLSRQRPDSFTMIVAYRGLHCPICKGYLQGLRELYDGFLDAGFEVLNVSMDEKARAEEAHRDWGLDPIPMGYGLSKSDAEALGLWLSESIRDGEPQVFSEPGLFWVRPDGRLYLAEVSSAPFVRPDLKSLLGRVGFIRDTEYPARGTLAA